MFSNTTSLCDLNRSEQLAQCIGGKLIRLHPFRRLDHIHAIHDAPQTVRYLVRGSPAGFVAVEHHDHMAELLRKKILLYLTHRGPHEGNTRKTGLRHFHTVEESFDKNDRQLPFHTMQVKEFERLMESRRKFVTRFRAIDHPTGVRDEFTVPVMDRDHASAMHTPFPWK